MTLAYFRHGIGVVGVSHGCCGYQGNRPSQLWLTTDMKHWRDVTPRDADHARFKADHPIFENAWFTDNRSGWVTTWDAGDIEVRIFRTTDAGRTWSEVSGGVHGAHAGATALVQPLSTTLAYKEHLEPTGPGMDLAVTHDGGRHWVDVYDGPPPTTDAHQALAGPFEMPMVFTSEQHGFAADAIPGADPIIAGEPNPGHFFVTEDGGHAWAAVHLQRPRAGHACPKEGDYKATVSCLDGLPTFFTPADGVLPLAIRQDQRAVIGLDVTRDGGQSWTLANTLKIPMPSIDRSPDGGYDFTTPLVSTPSTTTWWVTVPRQNGTASWWTSDSGRHWHHNAATLPGTPGALSATSGRSAWLTVEVRLHDGSTTRQLMRTTDGGQTWERVVPHATATRLTPQGVSFWSATRGLLVSTSATESCWVTGHACAGGRIEATSDGGRRWRTSLTTPESPFEISTTGTDIAWVSEGRCDIGDACDANRLLRTTDGGRTWTATPTSMPVRAVNAVSATMAWAIHDVTLSPARMELVRTTDGGRSWRSAGDPCSATNGHNPWLSGAAFPSASRGWVTCVGQPEQAVQSKAVLQTSDSGKTWTVVARSCPRLGTGSAHPARGGSLSCDGNNPTLTMRADGTGWLWGNRGGLNATSTFGHAWTPIATQVVRPDTTSAVGASLVSDKTGYLIVSGGFGRKLEVTYDGGRSWRALRSWPLAPWLTG